MMKKILFIFLLLSSVCGFSQIDKYVPAKPSVKEGLVLDLTNTLTPDQEATLEEKLLAYDDSTSNQIAVVIISTTGDYPIEDVALQILRRWGVGGQADKDNGIVLLIAKDDRKVRIEVGYGLEGAIPDMIAASIIDNELIPNFKRNNYYRGIEEGTDAIIKSAAGEYKPPPGYGKRKEKGLSFIEIMILIFVIFFILVIISGRGRNGGMMSRRGYHDWTGPTWFPSSGGGGGGWSGGGGGGFGGFGGGSGGGGGASGSW